MLNSRVRSNLEVSPFCASKAAAPSQSGVRPAPLPSGFGPLELGISDHVAITPHVTVTPYVTVTPGLTPLVVTLGAMAIADLRRPSAQ
ncbi:hypothetical protein [Rhodoblastus sp.]|uniref:hypothetical protein n=1 Tax=Rhodoblastus sp. TaxID=1962975 RepID=UPI0026164CAC|nr:hypothetical protein [Rhodoblastus sp.]